MGYPGTALPDGPRCRRCVDRGRSARRIRGDERLAVPVRRQGGRRLPAGRRRAGSRRTALAGLGRPDEQRSATHDTSYDDGAAGISDYLLQLSNVTGEPRFRTAALGGMRWLVAQAVGRSCPQSSGPGTGPTGRPTASRTYGVGMGQAGIVLALDTFADATGDSTFREYARAALPGCERSRGTDASRCRRGREHPGCETGFLNGSAGAAFGILERDADDSRTRRPHDGETSCSAGQRPREG